VIGAIAFGAAAGGAYWLWANPRIVFTNTLPLALSVTAGNRAPQDVAPRQTARFRVRRSSAAIISWTVIRPKSESVSNEELTNSQPLTLPSNPLQALSISASNKFNGRDFFIPLITNQTDQPLRIIPNAGLQENGRLLSSDCDCAAPPGAVRLPVGIFPLALNSTLTATLPDGSRAEFESFAHDVNPVTGEIGLKFSPQNFKRSSSQFNAF
jgi:hypothetical protein